MNAKSAARIIASVGLLFAVLAGCASQQTPAPSTTAGRTTTSAASALPVVAPTPQLTERSGETLLTVDGVTVIVPPAFGNLAWTKVEATIDDGDIKDNVLPQHFMLFYRHEALVSAPGGVLYDMGKGSDGYPDSVLLTPDTEAGCSDMFVSPLLTPTPTPTTPKPVGSETFIYYGLQRLLEAFVSDDTTPVTPVTGLCQH